MKILNNAVFVIVFTVMVFGCSNKVSNKDERTRPNIIIIFTDDMGYADLGVQGQVEDIKTPNIDALARDGVRMTSGYVSAPQCIPSRAGLLTGKYQQRFGLDDNNTIPLPLNEVTIGQDMQRAGYVTGMTGKWHLEPNHLQMEWINEHLPDLKKERYQPSDISIEMKKPYFPSSRGFMQYYYGPMNRFWANYDKDGNDIEPQWIEREGFRLDLQTEAALSFIRKNKEKPFFFYLPYFAPHVPLDATEKYLKRFPGEMPERRRYCLAMLSAIDDGVGEIRRALKAYNLLENTIIFFVSDNGAPLKIYKEDIPISFKGGAWDGSLNEPLVGEKGMISEGGIRVPFLVSWPAQYPKGKTYDRPVISLDMFATSLAAAGLKPTNKIDGVDLSPYLKGEKEGDPHDALYWRFWRQSSIREGNWKYLIAADREYLFDLSNSPVENNNLINQYPEKAKHLKDKLTAWASQLKVPGIPEDALSDGEDKWYEHYLPQVENSN